MLFNEIYSKYYYALAQMLTKAIEKPLSSKEIMDVVNPKLFANSSYWSSFTNDNENKAVKKLDIPKAIIKAHKSSDKLEVKFCNRNIICFVEYLKENELVVTDLRDRNQITIDLNDVTSCKVIKEPIWKKLTEKTPDGKYKSKIKHIPKKPLTTLEKQWLKTVLSDPKMKLFISDTQAVSELLSDVEPLYDNDVFVYYDQHSKSDPYDEKEYQDIFRTIIKAKENNKKLEIESDGRNIICVVRFLEYSELEDKFRLIALADGEQLTIELNDITSCEILSETATDRESSSKKPEKEEITLLLTDELNALDRMMLSFSDLEKEIVLTETTQSPVVNKYKITLRYYKEDEAELISRILSFGSVLKVCNENSEKFNLIRERLNKQYRLFSGKPELHIKVIEK